MQRNAPVSVLMPLILQLHAQINYQLSERATGLSEYLNKKN